ncbi:MAG: hypothetical protein M1822_005378 [Bathelium mastoideum]|nr:MAG: hypothetical protein M1822_005378 [Bathelium mastoideum]
MFYRPNIENHGLPFDPFKSCVIPRPIGWISTLSQYGIANLAPYSQFTNATFNPPYVLFSANQTSDGKRKDTVVNAESSGVFVWNMATYGLREAVNATSEEFPPGTDEFAAAGLEKQKATLSDVPMVKASPVHFECRYYTTIRLPGNPPMGSVDIIIGRVEAIHIADEMLDEEGKLDVARMMPIARCGYFQYTFVKDVFDMKPPAAIEQGLEGRQEKAKL